MFGSGAFGALGLGNENSVSYVNPAELTYFTKHNIRIKDIALGEQHSVFLSENGEVFTCGYGGDSSLLSFFRTNKAGALGHGTKVHLGLPKKIPFFEENNIKIKQISAGRYHTVALSETGQVYTWGRGSYGTLGNGKKSSQLSPILVNVLEDIRKADANNEVVKIDSADYFTAALTKDGDIFTWGENAYGQMGIGSGVGIDLVESESVPVNVEFEGDVSLADFACGSKTMILLDNKGNAYKTGMKFDYIPKRIEIPKDFEIGRPKKVFCGDEHYTILFGIPFPECRK